MDEILGTDREPIPSRPGRIPPTPTEHAQEFNEILSSVVLQLHRFKLETESALKRVRQEYKSVYQLLKHKDPRQTTSVFTPDVAKLLFKTDEPTHVELYATHKLLADDRDHFALDETRHVDTATFLVHSFRDVLIVAQVASWIRDWSAEIQSFLDKCCKLIVLSRSLPKTTLPTKLDVPVPSELHFSENDRYIIEALVAYVTGRRGFISTDLIALIPLILKRSGMYEADVVKNPGRNAVRLLLTEIGIWQPSENILSHMDAGVSVQRMYREQKVNEVFEDANAEIRHDFGDLPVYTIDDASAHELDDAISIEETDQGTWLHIHIANPSAFFGPQSHLASVARLRQNSLYLPNQFRPMLPASESVRGFSRASEAMPTMTFSARLSSDGNIADYKVRPGLVRNIKILTYTDVNRVIFPGEETRQQVWWTGSYTKPDYEAEGKTFNAITPEIQSHLEAIKNLVWIHRNWRTDHGALRMKWLNTTVELNPKPLDWRPTTPEPSETSNSAALRKTIPTFIRGHAGVKLTFNDQFIGSRSLIEEMMIIAGRVAGHFAREHNLPVAYRGLNTNMPESLQEECRSLHNSGTWELPSTLSRRVVATSAGWTVQTSPVPQSHNLLGISAANGGYVQVTSPMRRYLDNLAHWQFEAHLRGSSLPFSLAELTGTGETSLAQAARRVYRRAHFQRRIIQFYAAHAVSQLLADPDGVGSTHLEFMSGKPRLTGFLVDVVEVKDTRYMLPRLIGIQELGIQGLLVLEPHEKLPPFEKEFAIEIQEVNNVDGQIVCKLKHS
jgi:exoribonuclease II